MSAPLEPLTFEQRALLEPHAKHFTEMLFFVRGLEDEELANLLEACNRCGSSNCGWDFYAAAQYLKKEIMEVREIRAIDRARRKLTHRD